MTANRTTKNRRAITADAIVPNNRQQYAINGRPQAIVSITPGPVWLTNSVGRRIACQCPEGWLWVRTSEGYGIAATPETKFWAL